MKKSQRITFIVEVPQAAACGVSDPGRLRPENEDSIFLDKKGNFMLLADGMGGHERGGEASAAAIEIIQEFLQPEILMDELANITEAEGIPTELICLTSLVEEAVQKANSVIYERNQKAGYHRYMGTTVVGLAPVKEEYVLWFHVGDSRLYRWRDSALKQMTVDHSAYSEWERNGRLGPEPAKNIVTRAVGPEAITVADIEYDRRLKDDIYLMCSDGLTDMLSIEDISKILDSEGSLAEIANRLVDAANDAGGKDNVSVVLCRV